MAKKRPKRVRHPIPQISKNGDRWHISHPFLGQVDFDRLEEAYTHIRGWEARVEEDAASGNWGAVIESYHRNHRAKAFREYGSQLDDATYWRILGEIWIDADATSKHTEEFLQWFQSPRPERSSLMLGSEQAELCEMPDEVTVYRGQAGDFPLGLSWTPKRDLAVRFAKRSSDDGNGAPYVWSGLIAKRSVLGYFSRRKDPTGQFTDRDEIEIVADPAQVSALHRELLD